jgi:valyl-tRNA synthetase
MTTPAAAAPDITKGYEPKEVEARWYAFWEEGGFFKADAESTKPPYTIVLPPPNVTGSLHMGHALTATIQDILVRHKRMDGYNALWLPGIDHAGIATQMIVEKELQKTEGKNRHDFGREKFLEKVWEWKAKYGDRIKFQHKAIGASLDWSRERFTMDAGSNRAVNEVFNTLWEQGLLYRAERLINWDPVLRTALSDLEVDSEEGAKGELWSFAYPLADGSGEIVVATTRPETMLGDTAVAVHPEDERYKALIGKNVKHPLTGREFPIIGDAILVDPAFGTGAVKVTPAHDFNDFAVGERHNLPKINIFNEDATVNAVGGPFQGLDRFKARKAVKEKIAELGLDRGGKDHVLTLPKSQRTGAIVEPRLSTQWYVKIAPLAEKAIAAVEDGRTKFVPETWTATYMSWMKDIHDWCVSRQLWWGHQIPAWYVKGGDKSEIFVARSEAEALAQARAKHGADVQLERDEDVLDTWFSSGLWPFSTLGWPEKTADLKAFYPGTVMETGFDIIFFWVARMMMFGLHIMGEVPFRTVYLHAMVRDEKGDKMSKTKGNVIDPLQLTDGAAAADVPKALKTQYPDGIPALGADALRFTLASMAGQGRDIKLSVKRIEGYKAFANKLWNATRFGLMNLEGYDHAAARAATPSDADRWILARARTAAAEVQSALEGFRFSDYASTVYQFIWGDLCDWYIELSKSALYGDDQNAKQAAQYALVTALDAALRMLHPAMPFVTEELWQRLPEAVRPVKSICIAPFPKAADFPESAQIERDFKPILSAILTLRAFRGESGIPFGTRFVASVLAPEGALREALTKYRTLVEKLTNTDVAFAFEGSAPHAVLPNEGFEVRVKLEGLVDLGEERTRAEKELAKLEAEQAKLGGRLGNEAFVAKAPAEVIAKDRERMAELDARTGLIRRHLQALGAA